MDIVKDSLLKASVFTFLILVIVLVGLQMDDLRQERVQTGLEQSTLETETFQVLQDYVEGSEESFCKLSQLRFPSIGQRNAELGAELQRFDSQEFSNDEEYHYIFDRYYNNQLRFYMLVDDYNNQCGGEQDTILYFFDDSTDSQRQGAVLDEIGKDQSAIIFAFNKAITNSSEQDSPVVEILVKDHNVTRAPTLVINGEQKFEGFVSQGELENEILNN